MKYITIPLTLFLFSCNNDSITISKEEYKQLKGNTTNTTPIVKEIPISNRKWTVDFITIAYDNHELILWLNGYGSQMMHHPDCKKCKKDTL